MKKRFIIFISIFIIIILVKYLFSNYEIKYKINGYDIYTKYEGNRLYFEVKKDAIYNFDFYMKRKLNKTIISDIKELEIEGFNCIIPVIKNIQTYPLCHDNTKNELIDYNLINDDKLDQYKRINKNIEKPNKDFIYYNNLASNEYAALWTYKGYIIMNGKEYKNIELFKKDRYDNDLAHLINDTIYMPNYDQEHEFNELLSLNLTTQKNNKIKLDKTIDYDSYVVGNIKNKLYIYDNKASILYEINIRNGEVKIKSSAEKGYVKYENGKFISCSKSEYKVNKITINHDSSNYIYETDDVTYKMFKENKDLKTLINDKKIVKILELNNKLYYIEDNNLYIYSPDNGMNKIFYDYELSFNNSKAVFIYIK